jgi:hypothetical protein
MHLLWSSDTTLEMAGHTVAFGANPFFNIGQERGYGELWEGLKGVTAAALLAGAFVRWRQPAFLGLAFVFALIVGDNLLLLHEKAGIGIAALLGEGPRSMARHVGELVGFGALGMLVLAIFAVSYRGTGARGREVALVGLGIVALLGGFAVGVDVIHAAAKTLTPLPASLNVAFTVLEDGGEMMTLSLAAGFALATLSGHWPRTGILRKRRLW